MLNGLHLYGIYNEPFHKVIKLRHTNTYDFRAIESNVETEYQRDWSGISVQSLEEHPNLWAIAASRIVRYY